MTEKKRAFEMTIDIDARAEDVWRALTDARELMRWFPLDARVTPGPGGSMRWAWGDRWTWETRIDGWEPPRLLRLVQDENRPYDAEGRPLPADRAEPTRLALEFTLETQAGRTRLRLVHSGFGRGTAWDDEFDAISGGWQSELRNLRHYVTKHRGRDRQVGWATLSTRMPIGDAWTRLVGPDGFRFDSPAIEEGRPYTVTTAAGDRFSGIVQLHVPQREFSGTSKELEDGVFRLTAFRAAGETGVHVWAATHSPAAAARAREFGPRAELILRELFRTPRVEGE